jgi:TRAP-type C4-dicarboxylate transport system substrate-binding protein
MIDENFLYETGVYDGLTAEQRAAFLKLSKEELDRRVGDELATHLTDAQLAEFEAFMSQGADGATQAITWLTQILPDYQKIVLQTLGELKSDIITNRSSITR